ncbi:hypothetical protein QJS04_geneDACA025053 [Acorus gramineus]|uniref:Uncharacterized protein n=1 Tax=Acorus gramineus TaxID=55184 RepID=A0AAV9A062_ACOGR|nr:hypothetical protein QJS04_geneDACA025053 [Acorus gramineus]
MASWRQQTGRLPMPRKRLHVRDPSSTGRDTMSFYIIVRSLTDIREKISNGSKGPLTILDIHLSFKPTTE